MTVKDDPEGEIMVGTKPEKKPPAARGWQGSAKLDCVTLWFCCLLVRLKHGEHEWRHTFGKKSNSIEVPTSAMMLEGLKANNPSAPTVTFKVEAVAVTAGGA